MRPEDPRSLAPTRAMTAGVQAKRPEPWSPSIPYAAHSLEIPGRFGHFELISFLGHGGMGQVYKARDTRLDRIVALKLLLPGPSASEERFQREAKAQAKIDHDGVCQVFEVGESEGRAYIAMQYLDGRTLDQVASSLSFEEKVAVVHQVAEGVHAAHREALVHRDLKPSNIMVQRVDGAVKASVLDFGMVQVADDVQLTQTGEVIGTPHYMAPEQVRGDFSAIDRRTDIYSLGAILYELLTGQPPIPGANILEVLCRILAEDPPAPRELKPDVPLDLEWIVLRCLEKEARGRYESAAALVQDLERFRDGEPVIARQSTWRYRLVKKARKYRHWAGAAGLIVIMLTAMVWRDFNQRRAATEAARLTAQFLRQVEQIEWRARVEATLPLHDTRPSKNQMLDELELLEEEVEAAGDIAKGPGLFALGRGYHVLGDLDRGLEYLQESWALGNRDPLLSYDLGLAYGERYQELLERARLAADPEISRRIKQDAETRFRAPAVEHFRRAHEAGVGDSVWGRALIATYETRWNAALEALDEIEGESPWRYETHSLRSNIWRQRAMAMVAQGQVEEALPQFERAVAILEHGRRMGESDARIYSALCEVNAYFLSFYGDERYLSAEGREQLLEPCQQALRADSGSANAFISAATTAEDIAINLSWVGDGESKNYFEVSMEWASRGSAITPRSFPALKLMSRNMANFGFLAETAEERYEHLDDALDIAEKMVVVAPDDLEAVVSYVDIVASVAGYKSVAGHDVEAHYQKGADALEPLLLQEEPAALVLARHASLEVQRAQWYLLRGGDAEGSMARANASMESLGPDIEKTEFSRWVAQEACIANVSLSVAKAEEPTGAASCQERIARWRSQNPEDLEWALAEAGLFLDILAKDPSQLQTFLPDLEGLLLRLEQSELHAGENKRFLANWLLVWAKVGDPAEAFARLEGGLEAIGGVFEISQDLGDLFAKVEFQLFLAELERRQDRPQRARLLLEAGRRDLATIRESDSKRIHLALFETVANRIEAFLDDGIGRASSGLTVTMDAEIGPNIGWEALESEPYLRSDLRWWRIFLDEQSG